jgi:hypothetical protein
MPHPARLRRFARRHLPRPIRAALRRARDYAAAYDALVAAVEGRAVSPGDARPVPSGAAALRVQDMARMARAGAEFFELLSQGDALEAAATTTVRKLIKAGSVSAATSFADALASQPETAGVGHLAAGVAAAHRKLPELARAEFQHVSDEVWRRHAAGEYLEATYRHGVDRVRPLLRELVAHRHDDLGPEGWFEVLKYAFVAREHEAARQAYAMLRERAAEQPEAWAQAETEIAWLRSWMEREPAAMAPPVPEGHIPFALINFGQPGRAKASQNIGDHIQTLASLGPLARHQNIRFHAEDDMAAFVTTVQEQINPDYRLDTPPGDVTLFTVDRDVSTYQAVPEGTWVFAFGWYMHPLFGVRHDFPLHPNLRPVFVSFHCNKREMLTSGALDYLRRHGPIGCRDWTTVDLLLSIGVPAFFSGCLTTTVDTVLPVFEPTQRPARSTTVYVEMPPGAVPAGAASIRHSYPEVKRRPLVANLREAMALLERYRHRYTNVVTTRLHCYLPVRSLGLNVDFRPKNRADVRLNGLIDIDDATVAAIRERMLSRLETITSAILAGKPEVEVYQLWRDICAEDVAAAKARHASGDPLPAPSLNVARVAAGIRLAALSSGPTPSHPVDVLIMVGKEEAEHLPIMLDSLLAHTSKPPRLWLLAHQGSDDAYRKLARAFPDVAMTWLMCDSATRNAALILLPELLPQLDRVTMLPAATVVLGDIAELAAHDLGGQPLAARSSVGTAASSGFGVLYRAARRLHPNAAAAHDFYRRVHARHVFDFDAFDTDVLVLDLAKARVDGLSVELLPYVEHFGLTAAEALILYAGPDRAVLPPEWAHIPTQERIDAPKLVYWPGSAKPWKRRYVAGRELWTRFAESRRSLSL